MKRNEEISISDFQHYSHNYQLNLISINVKPILSLFSLCSKRETIDFR